MKSGMDLIWCKNINDLPEVNNAMSFLTKNNFIAGPNNPQGTVAMWVFQHNTIGVDGEIINNDNKTREGNNAALGILPADQENYKIFNSQKGEMKDFVNMKSPWCLVLGICNGHL